MSCQKRLPGLQLLNPRIRGATRGGGAFGANQKNIAPSQLRSFGLCVSFLHYRSATREFENPAAAQPVMLTYVGNNLEPIIINSSMPLHRSATRDFDDRIGGTYVGSALPSLSLAHSALLLQWARPSRSISYRPKSSRCWTDTLVSLLLLLSGNVEVNPGPVRQSMGATSTTSTNVGCFNVRSAVHKAALLHTIIEDNKINILALQETWIGPDAPPAIRDDIAPPGYSAYHVHRPTRGGGLAIVIQDHFQARPVDLKWKPKLFELQVLRVQLNTKRQVLIANVYQPASPPSSGFFDELDEMFLKVSAISSDVIVCGDFNCPSTNSNRVSSRLEDSLISADLEQHVHEPTRGNNLLDIFATSDPDLVSSISIVDSCSVSDHGLVVAAINADPAKPDSIRQTFRNLKSFDASQFESSLRRSTLFTAPAETAEEFSTQLLEIVSSELNKVCPLKTKTCRPPNPTSRWLSPEAKDAKRERRRLERTWCRTRNETDRLDYRASCRRANFLIKDSRKKHLAQTISSCSSSKQRWKTVNNLLHPNSRNNSAANNNSINSTTFLDFFTTKINNLKLAIKSKIDKLRLQPPLPDPIHSGALFSTVSPVTPAEVSQLLRSLQPKSSNLDFIPTSLIKACSSTFSYLIAHLANLSFNQGVFPSHFKIAQITPLIKKPKLNMDDPSNYRPISNLNNISKILERLFLARLQPHLINSPHYNPFQSAYRSCHSTETALLTLLNKTRLSADQGESTLLVSLDLSAAFDTIDHAILLDRLRLMYGVEGTALNWLRSYLNQRFQYVKVGQDISPSILLSTGVPQGSVLGPILFTSFISPIQFITAHFKVDQQQYADDTQLFISMSKTNSADQIHCLESALLHLTSWFYFNCLALNPEKSEAILLGTHARNKSLGDINQVDIAGSPIPLSDNIKLLGTTIDSTLNFSKHVSLICQSCQYHIRALRHIRPILDAQTARLVGHALVSSRLDYANSILYGSPKSQIAKLQSQQNALARVVMRASFGSAKPLLHELHWLPVASRIEFKIATLTYKILDTGLPSYLSSHLSHYHPARELRSSSSNLLAQPYSSTNFGSLAFTSSAPKIWNRLPLEVKSAYSLQTFKSRLKTHYFSKPSA